MGRWDVISRRLFRSVNSWHSIWHEENNSEKFLPIEPVKSLSYDLVDYYIATNEIQYESFESLTEHSNEDFDLTQFRFN